MDTDRATDDMRRQPHATNKSARVEIGRREQGTPLWRTRDTPELQRLGYDESPLGGYTTTTSTSCSMPRKSSPLRV
jgi:hypothetical protein